MSQLVSPQLPVLLLVLSLLCLIYNYLIYPAFISPLAKLPNVHLTSPISKFWIKSQKRKGTTGIRQILLAHKKHGPIVRVSPYELSVSSLDGLRQAYAGGFEKSSFYHEFENYGTPNLVSLIHNRPHANQKRMISNVYSKSFVHNSPDLKSLSRVILYDRLLPALSEAARTGADFNAYRINQALGADFMNAYLFGTANGTDFIRDPSSLTDFMVPFHIKFKGRPGHEEAGKKVEARILDMCKAAEGVARPPYQIMMSLPPTEPIVYSQMLTRLSKEQTPGFASPRIVAASEMMDQIVAAIETTRVVLTYAQWELSQRPDLATALQKELLTLDPPIINNASHSIPPDLPDPKAIDALPLLNAVLKEVLRLYSPSPGMFPRMTPLSGAAIDGYRIPGGVSIAASSYCLHRNEEVFPDAESFRIERWLTDQNKGVDGKAGPKTEQDKWFWAFGSGGRMCIGSHYSIYMLKICIAAFYTNYSTTIVDDRDIEQEDAFIAGPKGETLILKITPAT